MEWRRLRPDETDHELLWLCVSVGTALFCAIWLHFGMPVPKCAWHALTGWPCLGCGGTRCARYLLHGAWVAAFKINPGVFLLIAGIVVYDLYALAVLALRLPRLRVRQLPHWAGALARWTVVLGMLLNWAWLVAHHV